jgi:hypothetical protein
MALKLPLPDQQVGWAVVGIVLKGGWEILEQARDARRAAASDSGENPADGV